MHIVVGTSLQISKTNYFQALHCGTLRYFMQDRMAICLRDPGFMVMISLINYLLIQSQQQHE